MQDEPQKPANAWLNRLRHAERSWAGNLFLAEIGDPSTAEPRAVCRAVALKLKAGAGRPKGLDDPQVRAIFDAMIEDPEGAMAYAADRIAHAKLSKEERAAKRAIASEHYRREWLRRQS